MSELNTINISNYVGKQILGDKCKKKGVQFIILTLSFLSFFFFLLANGCLMIMHKMKTLFSSHI